MYYDGIYNPTPPVEYATTQIKVCTRRVRVPLWGDVTFCWTVELALLYCTLPLYPNWVFSRVFFQSTITKLIYKVLDSGSGSDVFIHTRVGYT